MLKDYYSYGKGRIPNVKAVPVKPPKVKRTREERLAAYNKRMQEQRSKKGW